MLRKLMTGLLVLTATACASSGSTPDTDAAPAGATVRRSANGPITLTDLSDPRFAGENAYDVVRQLRPSFFNSRSAGGGLDSTQHLVHAVLVSIDNGALSPLEALQSIRATQVQEISFLKATDAAQRFGTTSTGGPVILVTTRRQ